MGRKTVHIVRSEQLALALAPHIANHVDARGHRGMRHPERLDVGLRAAAAGHR
jgi:hypothetical protein